MILDTHKAIERLKKAGADPKLAEGIVDLHYRSEIYTLETRLQGIEEEFKLLRLELQRNLYK